MKTNDVEIVIGQLDLLDTYRKLIVGARSTLYLQDFPWDGEIWCAMVCKALRQRMSGYARRDEQVPPLDVRILWQGLQQPVPGPLNVLPDDLRLQIRRMQASRAARSIRVPILLIDSEIAVVGGFEPLGPNPVQGPRDSVAAESAGYALHGAAARKLGIEFAVAWNAASGDDGASQNIQLPPRMRGNVGTGIDDARRRVGLMIAKRSTGIHSPITGKSRGVYGDFGDAFC